MSTFSTISPAELSGNIIQRISRQWALATAEKPDGTANTMTISWGGTGYLWNQPVAFLFVRPQRYTYEFVEAADGFSLCFLPSPAGTRTRSPTAASPWPIRTGSPTLRSPRPF